MNIFTMTEVQKSFIRTTAIFCLSFLFLTTPFLVLAQTSTNPTGLVPCDGPKSIAGSDARTCNFQALLRGINEIINWMFIIAVPLSLVSFAYAGILFMSGKEDNISQGKEIFSKVVWGVVIMAGAWLLVRTIVRGLLNPDGSFGSYLFGL